MSHSYARFIFQDGQTLHGEYNGTSDVMLPLMFDTRAEAGEHWRKQEWKDCECQSQEPCVAHADYGGGFWWLGMACRHCRVFVGPKMPFDDDVEQVDSKEPPIPSDVWR